MPNTPAEPLYGASCFPEFAKYLGGEPSNKKTIDLTAKRHNQYLLVHLYLIPPVLSPATQENLDDESRNRWVLRDNLDRVLSPHHGIKIHDCAYAIPVARGDERDTATAVWQSLMAAGVYPERPNEPSLWRSGDVVYVHYVGWDGMRVLAAAPPSGAGLPDAVDALI